MIDWFRGKKTVSRHCISCRLGNSLAYRLLWPSQEDRATVSGKDFDSLFYRLMFLFC